jgi:hypothetical protein
MRRGTEKNFLLMEDLLPLGFLCDLCVEILDFGGLAVAMGVVSSRFAVGRWKQVTISRAIEEQKNERNCEVRGESATR